MNTYLGKSCSLKISASAFRKLPSIYVFSYFPFGFEGRMWDLIVSVPDHCFLLWTWHLSDFPQIWIYDVFCRVNKGYKTHFPLKTKWLSWQRKVNFGHL